MREENYHENNKHYDNDNNNVILFHLNPITNENKNKYIYRLSFSY